MVLDSCTPLREPTFTNQKRDEVLSKDFQISVCSVEHVKVVFWIFPFRHSGPAISLTPNWRKDKSFKKLWSLSVLKGVS